MTHPNQYPGWQDRARAMLRAIDPTFADPVYLLDLAETTGVATADGCVLGFTSGLLDRSLRPLLGSRGEWRGPGVAIVLDAAAFPSMTQLLGTALHEYGHLIQHAKRRATMTEAAIAKYAPAGPIHVAAEIIYQPWTGHGADFHRLAIHLENRAYRAGYWIGLRYVIRCDYGLGDVFDYDRALGDEPDRLAALSMAEVHAAPWPAAFTEFAAARLAAAEANHNETRQATEDAVVLDVQGEHEERNDTMSKLLDLFRAKRKKTRDERWRDYLTLLARSDRPKTGDAEALEELVTELEIDPLKIGLHAILLKEYDRLDSAVKPGAAAAEGIDAISLERAAIEDEVVEFNARIQARLEPLTHREAMLRQQKANADAAAERLGALAVLYPEILPEGRTIAPPIFADSVAPSHISPAVAQAVANIEKGLDADHVEPEAGPKPVLQIDQMKAAELRARRAENARRAKADEQPVDRYIAVFPEMSPRHREMIGLAE